MGTAVATEDAPAIRFARPTLRLLYLPESRGRVNRNVHKGLSSLLGRFSVFGIFACQKSRFQFQRSESMVLRMLALFTFVVAIGNGVVAQQNDVAPKVGDDVVIRM